MKSLTLAGLVGLAIATWTWGEAKAGPPIAPALELDNGVVKVFGWRRHRHQERYAYYYSYPWHHAPGAYPFRQDYYRPHYYQPYSPYHYQPIGPKLRPWHRRQRHGHRHGDWK